MGTYWNERSLADKVVIVTGAGMGIGRGITEALGARGAAVLAVDRVPEAVDKAVQELTAQGYRVVGLHQDITAPGSADLIVQRAINEFGHLTSLVNNAASGHMPTPLHEMTDEKFLEPFETGPRATFNLMRAAYPHLKAAGGGSIVNFGSGAGTFGEPGFTGYANAKEGIRGISKVAAMDWGADGIRVNVVAPAALTEGMLYFKETAPEAYEAILRKVPLGRLGDPVADIAPVVAFLLSDESAYVTAQTFMVDGGSSATR